VSRARAVSLQGGKQRERGGEHEQHAERGGDRDAVEEADAEGEHAEQRDHDRRAGEEDRPPGGGHRQLDSGGDIAAVLAVGVAVAREDEERVVDADAEPDHQREVGGEVDHVDKAAAERDQAEAGPEPEQSGHDRQSHREQGAEAEQQHDDRGADADNGREADAGLLRLLDRGPAELDLQRRGCSECASAMSFTSFLLAWCRHDDEREGLKGTEPFAGRGERYAPTSARRRLRKRRSGSVCASARARSYSVRASSARPRRRSRSARVEWKY
jgi:hypothetical protein